MNLSLPLLFSRTSKGQVQTWQITVEKNTFFTAEGIKGGTISVSKPTVCIGKNIGKNNETTPEQQAYAQAKSKWQKKLDEGYCDNEADIDTAKFFEPMLAHKWPDYKDETDFPVYSQPKLDGMRCIVTKDGMFSRKGKEIKSAPHIRVLLDHLFKDNPKLVLDGELYNHKFKHDFNKIISLAKKTKPTVEDLAESEELLEYWIYDYVFEPGEKDQFSLRMADAKDALETLGDLKGVVRWVKTKHVKDKESLDELFAHYIDEGFEGQMIRVDSAYENKRTKALLKRKDFIDKEYRLVDIEEGDGNRAGLATVAYFADPNGSEVRDDVKCFKTGVIGNNEYTAKLLKEKKKYIGKPGTVVFFNLTPDGVPRFGKMKIIRDYE